ncbi:transcription factor TFIIIC, tau55 subunit [Yamadazyma tenuis ATCC 10573]|uniref:Transcription factor TFIIIC, tau55 subunit n=1 Tax=Candida tenuis (strain ATCC 10573 / BCRC 21748 / CBS 615 / JCM 9827 / NBRC 10315 / NRRL Y-1498 / VKM Y-70) TaxID=590646 RepID=G3B960_CANTC|nr:transcription factor TFIIIC, tau55 subunit [Yamadazyma tenuis ATCC 10573]EGV62470.1 transcription factor TFIIIC, tau55 subunit [Yamadazyma tenuis ATCC 10573]
MALKHIYIARHGYRMNWLPPPHPPNPTGIDSDPPLAPHGVDQAKELAEYIASLPHNQQPQFILSSPFYRCVETGEPISKALDIPIVLERGVGEWYKVGRGVIPEPANYDALSKFFSHLSNADEWDRDKTVGVVPSLTGETETDIFARCKFFWSKFFSVFESKYPHIENILIITHAATKIALGMSLMGFNDVFEYLDKDETVLRAGACSLDKYQKVGETWELKMNGNCEFLSQGEEMNWDFHSGFEAGSDEDIKARRLAAEREKQANQDMQVRR